MKITMLLIAMTLSAVVYAQKVIPRIVDSSNVSESLYEDIRYPGRIIEKRYVIVYTDVKGKLLNKVSIGRKFFMSNFRIGVDTPMIDRLFGGSNEPFTKPDRMDFQFAGYHEVSRNEILQEFIGKERPRSRRVYNSSAR
jgi:hypothetical protein